MTYNASNSTAVLFNVKNSGAKGDGSTDDTASIATAVTAASVFGGTVYFPDGVYLITSTLSIPSNVRLLGNNRFTTQLKLGAAVDLINLGNGAQLEHLYLNGNSQVGRGIYIQNTLGQQTIHDCNIINFAAPCIEFEPIGGAEISVVNVLAYRSDGASGSGNYAIKIAAPVIGAAASAGSTSTTVVSTAFGDTTHATGYYNGACIGFDTGALAGTFQTISASVNNGGGSWTFTTSAFSGAPSGGDTFHTFVNSAQPRKFVHFASGGDCSFDFGMSNDTMISGGGYIGDLNYTTQSRSVQINGCRLGGSGLSALNISGDNHTIVGCDVFPQLTVTAGTEECGIGFNSLNNPPVIDNSGNATNSIDIGSSVAFTPVASFGGTAVTIGNGVLTGLYTRTGRIISTTVDFTWGSTSNLNSGSGNLTFTLPSTIAPVTTGPGSHIGTCEVYDATGNLYYACMARATPGSTTITVTRTSSNTVSSSSPAAPVNLWHARFTLTYPI